MVQANKNIITLLASLFILFSCSDETLIGPGKIEVEEGIPVTATFSFNSSNTVKIETKASDIADENPVNSLAILIFKTTGEKIKETAFFSSDKIQKGNITVPTTSGNRYVYAVANYKSSLFDLEDELKNISSLRDLKNLAVKLPENNISVLDGQFLMSGAYVGGQNDEEGFCVIGTDGIVKNADTSHKNSGKIDLKRIMASIKFNISSGNPNATFVADSWQVKNVPQMSNLIEQESSDYSGGKGDYLSSKLNSGFEIDDSTYSFSFLMLENRKQPQSIPASYDEREEMSGSPESFSVANPNSTYVVLKGTYTGKSSETVDGDSSEKDVKAFTTYYVHLGDWRDNQLANFDIFRNNRYTYNVSVQAVDKLIVEVVKDDEVWGGDGEIYLSTTRVRTFDAHYGTTVISFDKKVLQELIYENENAIPCTEDEFIKKFKILASTPKNDFQSNETDVDWVRYKRNTLGNNEFMKYEGSNDLQLFDADQFRSDLYDAVIKNEGFDSGDSIRYTCFIDEYYYDGMRLSEFINQQPRTIQIWTYYKSNDEQSSNSSVSMAAYTFSQRSICTVYDLDKLDANKNINGWGTEWTQEGENLPTAISENNNLNSFTDNYNDWDGWDVYKNDLLQGRENMIAQLANRLGWDDYVDYKTNNLNHLYKYAEYACLNRNRDLNGNGVLDEDEIRWYLPSINQYMGYSMGDNVLPEEVRLFTGNTYDRRYIYLSNTVVNRNGGRSNPNRNYDTQVFWACEGSSTGYYRDAVNELNGYGIDLSKMPYRCIRNLRNVSEPVDDFVVPSKNTVEPNEPAFAYLDFTYLNPRAMRSQVNQALTPYHKNTEEENRLPEGIEIGLIEGPFNNWYTILSGNAVNTNPCEKKDEGWRLPNQRELTIMTSHAPIIRKGNVIIEGEYGFEAISLTCCTMAKYSDSDRRVYFTYITTLNGAHNITQGGPDINHPYRCVRDKKITNK